MKVYLIMSGCGCPRGLNYVGEREVMSAADFLKGQKISPSHVHFLTSKEAVSVDSARIIKKALGLAEPAVVNWLNRSAPAGDLWKEVKKFSDEDPNRSTFLVVSNVSVVENVLSSFARRFEPSFEIITTKGSVHLVDTDARTLAELFVP